jgi:hypothetical protein
MRRQRTAACGDNVGQCRLAGPARSNGSVSSPRGRSSADFINNIAGYVFGTDR